MVCPWSSPFLPSTLAALLGIASLSGLLGACSADEPSDPEPDPDPDPGAMPSSWAVHVSPEAPEGVRIAADDVAGYLEALGLEVTRVDGTDGAGCEEGQGAVLLLGDGLGTPVFNPRTSTDQTWRMEETRCGRAGPADDGADAGAAAVAGEPGAVVELSGNGLLGRQYAAYEWLHAIGVRFFHPEETFVPPEPAWPSEPVDRSHTPPFTWRSVSLHLTHPLELGDAFRLGNEEHFPDAVRYIDWQLRNGASYGHGGIGDGEYSDYGHRRGFPTDRGMSLHNAQQGGRPIVDSDDPRPWQEQIEEAIVERMGDDPEGWPDFFSFSFNPSEFTEISDELALEQITFIADYFADNHPDTILLTTNHGTAGEPTETYGIRYYDLPGLAPPNLGVKVHSLMFYDLFRPAPVYGNEDFQFLYDFMVHEYEDRRLWHFPESAWWLTFDNTVPLYLPITVEARDRDIQGISFMLDGGLDGHRVFGSGHEWGYWQNEYCSFRMAADLEYRWTDCFADIATVAGDVAPVVQDVLQEAVFLQERDIIWGGLIRYLVGSDDETELAAAVGIGFHPLPPSPQEIARWDVDAVVDWKRRVLPALQRSEQDNARLVGRLNDVRDQVPEPGLNFFDEIRDGLEANELRARHAWQAYGALVYLRESQLRFDASLADRAQRWYEDARATTEAALEVIHRREEGYRYLPLERSIGGGPEGTEDDNWTIYDYRVHNRTHHAWFYERTDDMVEEALAGGGEQVVVEDALVAPDETMVVRLVDDVITGAEVTWGDGEGDAGGPLFEHMYAAPDYYTLALTGTREGSDFSWEAPVAALADEHGTGFTGTITAPDGVGLIEPVMPGLVFGPVDDARGAVGFSLVSENVVRPELWYEVTRAAGSTMVFESEPTRMVVPVVNQSTGEVQTSIVVDDAVVELADAAGPALLRGQLDTGAVVDAVVAIGGFDEPGARNVVASTLGYTPDTLPAFVDFVAEYAVE